MDLIRRLSYDKANDKISLKSLNEFKKAYENSTNHFFYLITFHTSGKNSNNISTKLDTENGTKAEDDIGDTSIEIDFSSNESKKFTDTEMIENPTSINTNINEKIQFQNEISKNFIDTNILEKITSTAGDFDRKKSVTFDDEIKYYGDDSKNPIEAIKDMVILVTD